MVIDIELLKRIIKFRYVELIANENLEPISTATVEIPRKSKNSKFKVPLWLAEELIKSGKARIPETLINWVYQTIWKEKVKPQISASSLSKQDDNFYPNIILLEMALKYDKLLYLDEKTRENIKHSIRQIINKRMETLLRIGESDINTIYDKLTIEEKILLKNIRELIKNWIEFTGVDKL